MSQTDPTISKLLQLKRYEQPEEGFAEDFLAEFNKRQRSELLQKSSLSLFLERFTQWRSEFNVLTWSASALAALVVSVLGFSLFQVDMPSKQNESSFVVNQVQVSADMVPINRSASIDLVDSTFGSSQEVLPVTTVASFEF